MSVAIAQTCCEHGVEFVDRGCTGAEIKMIKEGRFPRLICSL